VKSVYRDLLAFEEKTEGRFDRLENKIDAVDQKIDVKVDGLAKALPRIVGDAVREANRDRDRKR
jgi:hypothetical protein